MGSRIVLHDMEDLHFTMPDILRLMLAVIMGMYVIGALADCKWARSFAKITSYKVLNDC